MTTITVLPTLTRDDLGLSFGHIRDLINCPACKSGPGFDSNGEVIGEDRREFALATDEGRLCEPCAEAIVGEDVLLLLEQLQNVSAYLFSLVESGGLEYGRQLVRIGVKAILRDAKRYGRPADAALSVLDGPEGDGR